MAAKQQKSVTAFFKGVLRRDKQRVALDSDDGSIQVSLPRGIAPATIASGQMYYAWGALRGRTLRVTSLARAELPVPTASGGDHARFTKIMEVLAQRRSALLGTPGVLDARAGYRYVNGWTTKTPAIVVSFDPSQSKPDFADRIDGVPVDLRPATPVEELLAAGSLTPNWVHDALGVEPLAVPGWEERERAGPLAAGLEAAAAKAATRMKYVPPPNVKLDAISGSFDLLCHSSPDAGWPVLEKFLQSTKQTLTIAMYDFTAPHIAKSMVSAHQLKALTLVLDPGEALGAPSSKSKNPKAHDEHETAVVKSLESNFKRRFTFAWAAVKRAGKTERGIFPTAYHIKVAVGDSGRMWLSSGNWQSSNQPDIPQLTPTTPGLQDIFKTYNREWHVVAANAALAKLFETFIKWDCSQAEKVQVHPLALNLPPLSIPDDAPLAAALPQVHPPQRFTGKYTVQPLLTPDNYLDHVRKLVENAQHSLRIQNQYIKLPARGGEAFIEFLTLLRDKSKEMGPNFRVIVRNLPGVSEQLEALEHFGFNMDQFKRQANTHTKGIIIDERTVVVGSHNWSNQGVLENRDASLVIADAKVAAYYRDLFDHDWDRLAYRAGSTAAAAMSFTVSWDEYLS